MPAWLEQVHYGNSVALWLAALGIALLAFLAGRVFIRLALRRLASLSERSRTTWDDLVVDLLKRSRTLLVALLALYLGSLVLRLPAALEALAGKAVLLAVLLQFAFWGDRIVSFWVQRGMEERLRQDPNLATTVAGLRLLGRIVLWSIFVLIVLDNLGVNITALVAGLGVGGVAVALALQNVLGDLFASLSIVLDKPFVIGDFVIVGEHMGTIERIGLKTTRVRSLSGEQLVFANNDLLQSRIRNYKRMEERRVVFELGVVYETPADQLEAIPGWLRQIVEAEEQTRFDRAHFKRYGDFSLAFEVVYYVLSADYNVYMDIQQRINLQIFRRFANEGVAFAYPTNKLYVASAPREG